MHAIRSTTMAAVVALLAACAGYGPPDGLRAGTPEADVVRYMGAPTGRYALPDGGERLEFARGPYGRDTFMIDVDARHRVVRWDQVLTPKHFQALHVGMTADELLKAIGRPSERMGMMRDGRIWSWRYFNNDCLWWQAQLDAHGVVTSLGYGIDWRCDPPNDRS
ncbi:MAG: hypothetical protein LKCHEGNO_02470 [Burkholderiaceae bacterium]|nr:hypothetical protein [Burkholderiaceae bacterium]